MFDNATKFFEIPLICPTEAGNNSSSHSIIVDVIGDITSVCVRVGNHYENQKEYLYGFWSHGWYTETKTEIPFCDEMNKLIEQKIAHMVHRQFDHDEIQKMTARTVLRRTRLVYNQNLEYATYSEQAIYLIVLNDIIYLKTSNGMYIGMWQNEQFSFLLSYDQMTDVSKFIDLNDIEVLQNMKMPFDISKLHAIGFREPPSCPAVI